MESAIFVSFVLLLIVAAYRFRFVVDDAYISMRYARHLAEGHGLVYNLGEPVEGYSNLLWVLILAAAYRAGFSLVISAEVIGVICSVCTLILVWRLAARLLPAEAGLVRLFPVLFLSVNWMYIGWATGGLETSLFTLLATYAVSRWQMAVQPWRDWIDPLPLSCLLLVLTRPEGMLLVVVLLVATIARAHRTGSSTSRWLRPWLIVAAAFVFVTISRRFYYGDWLPNSFYVKVNKLQYLDRGAAFFRSFAVDSCLGLWGPAAIVSLLFLEFTSLTVVVYAVLYILFTVWVGGDWMGYRFYHHLWPLLSVPVTLVVWSGTRLIGRAFRELSVARILGARVESALIAIATCGALSATGLIARQTFLDGRDAQPTFKELPTYRGLDLPEHFAIDVAHGLSAVLRPGEAASATFAGFTAVNTDLVVIDALGLNDRYVARLPAVARGTPGHEKVAPREYLLSRKVLLVNPWPREDPGDVSIPYGVSYAPGKFLVFDTLLPAYAFVDRLQARGFTVYAGGQPVFNPSAFTRLPLPLNLDFEDGSWRDWEILGTAFGQSPRDGARWLNVERVTGMQGQYFVNTFQGNSDAPTGMARSRPFVIAGNAIDFLIAGGSSPATALELWVDGQRVRTASGRNSEEFLRRVWMVSEFVGRIAFLVIRDDATTSWGHILVDDIQLGNVSGNAAVGSE